jgi:hypothetical protein
VLTAIAAFSEAFVNPIVPLLTLALASLVARRWLVRALAAAAGCAGALATHLGDPAGALALETAGSAAAWLLHGEIALHLVLPALRWLYRFVTTAWELAWLMLAMLRGLLWRRHRQDPPGPTEKDRTP